MIESLVQIIKIFLDKYIKIFLSCFLFILSGCASEVWRVTQHKDGGVIAYQENDDPPDVVEKKIQSLVHCLNYRFTGDNRQSSTSSFSGTKTTFDTTYIGGKPIYSQKSTPYTNVYTTSWRERNYECLDENSIVKNTADEAIVVDDTSKVKETGFPDDFDINSLKLDLGTNEKQGKENLRKKK